MRRLFWVSVGVTVGAVGAVIVVRRVEAAVRRYTPEGVAEQVGEAGRAARTSLGSALATFRSARAEREHDLVTTLLVEPDAGDPGAVFGRHSRPARPDAAPRPGSARPGGAARPPARVDLDEPLADF